MSSRKLPAPEPRPFPLHVGVVAPNHELNQWVRSLSRELEAAQREATANAEATSSMLGVALDDRATPRMEMFSALIQVVVAMTIDGSISMFVVAKYGGRAEEYFRWTPSSERLRKALAGAALPCKPELAELVARRAKARNDIVHPYSAEHAPSDPRSHHVPDRGWPDASVAAATAAVEDLRKFFDLLGELDDEAARLVCLGSY